MLIQGPAKKLTVYLDENEKVHGKPLFEVILDILFRHKAAGASVFRGIEGYGASRAMHTAKILELSTTLPVKIEVVDTEEKIDALLLEITPIVHKGLIEVNDTKVIKSGSGKA
ncbi:MAG: DUF190 domain-containing protein [Nitrospiraceae bacterium]|nr:DUF190 domain-containing protein [Nitrospiraceae bacterium]